MTAFYKRWIKAFRRKDKRDLSDKGYPYSIGEEVEVRIAGEWRKAKIVHKIKMPNTDIPTYRVEFPDGTRDMMVFDGEYINMLMR